MQNHTLPLPEITQNLHASSVIENEANEAIEIEYPLLHIFSSVSFSLSVLAQNINPKMHTSNFWLYFLYEKKKKNQFKTQKHELVTNEKVDFWN